MMGDPLRFAKCDTVIEAITEYLRERGIALIADEIADGVVKGGFRAGKPEGRIGFNVRKAIHVHTHGMARRARLRKVGDLVGLSEWPDERFR